MIATRATTLAEASESQRQIADVAHRAHTRPHDQIEAVVLPEREPVEDVILRDVRASGMHPEERQHRARDREQQDRYVDVAESRTKGLACDDLDHEPREQAGGQHERQGFVGTEHRNDGAAVDPDDQRRDRDERERRELRIQSDGYDER